MFRYITMILFLASSMVQAQITFQKTYGGIEDEDANAFVETYDHGFMIAGSTKSYGAGNFDLYIIRTDPQGNPIWTKTFGGTGYDKSQDIIKTDTAEYLIAAFSSSASDANIYLVKIDDNGDTLWTKTVGTEDNDHVTRIKKTNDGGFVLCGYIERYFEYKYLIWKFSSSGDSVWAKTYDFGWAQDIDQTNDGGYMMVVYPYANLTPIQDFQLVKTNSSGDTLWTKFYGGTDVEVAYAGEQVTGGGYIIAGRTNSYGNGASDFYLIKTNGSGDLLWDKTFGGDLDDRAFSMTQTSDGGFIVGGYTASFNVGYFDFYMVRTNSGGDTLWTKTYGAEWQEEIYDIKESSDGGFAAVGYTHSYGAGTNPNIYFVKTDAQGLITEVEDQNIPNNFSFELKQNYPNPFNPSTKISFTIPQDARQETKNVSLKIYDILGNKITTLVNEEKPTGNYEVDFNQASSIMNLASGIYFYQLKFGDFVQTKKMIYLK
jgi:hypothetical protein